MTHQHICLFGTPVLMTHASAEPIVRTPKALAVLGYLAHQREPITRIHLATLLWSETTDYRSRRNLTHVLGQLTDRLPGCFLADQQTVMWHPHAPLTIDVRDCADLLHAVAQNSGPAPELQARQLAQVVAQYQGEFLAGLTLSDSPEFELWLLRERERWRQQIVTALDYLSSYQARQGNVRAAEAALRRWIELEPWQEEAYRALMRLLADHGRRAEALTYYETCRRLLAEDLGITPTPETLALRTDLMQAQAPMRAVEHGGHNRPPSHTMQPTSLQPTQASSPSAAPNFYGRADELAQVHTWFTTAGYRVVGILGMGGIGKTALAEQYVQRYTDHYSRVIWRSLLNSPTLGELLESCLSLFPDAQQPPHPASVATQLELLFATLRTQRCLLVLDNVESILRSDDRVGQYRAGYEAYGQLFVRMQQHNHASCLLLTSREPPPELTYQMTLTGLDPQHGSALLQAHGLAEHQHLSVLVQRYSGNPLALKLIADVIRDIYAGSITTFTDESAPIFDDIRTVLDQQFARCTPLERAIMDWLVVAREPMTEAELWQVFARVCAKGRFLEALRSLLRRSLLERDGQAFGLQNVVIEYLTDQLIEQIYHEIETESPILLHSQPLLITRSKAYVRQSQRRVILQPLLDRLIGVLGQARVVAIVRRLLDTTRNEQPRKPSYLAGSILNMLVHMQVDLRGIDLSQLSIWQADVRGIDLHGVDLRDTDLRDTIFTDYVGAVMALACSPNGQLLAVGADNGTIYLFQMADQQLVGVCLGHTSFVSALAFSPDGRHLVSGSDDLTLRIWEVATRRTLHQFTGHTGGIPTVAVHPDGITVASGSTDQTARIWDSSAGTLRHILVGHQGTIPAVQFSPDGTLLVTCSYDQTIRVWAWRQEYLVRTLAGHTDTVSAIALFHQPRAWASQTRTILVSGSHDATIRLWDIQTGEQLALLNGHSAPITSLALGADDTVLCSGSDDLTIRVWSIAETAIATGSPQVLRTLRGHSGTIYALAMPPQRDAPAHLISGSPDKTVRFWDVQDGHQLEMVVGYSKWLQTIMFRADGSLRVAGNDGYAIRVWDGRTGRTLQMLRGHTALEKLTFSSDGSQIVSAGWDATVRVWDLQTGHQSQILREQMTPTLVALISAHQPGQRIIANTCLDRSISIWDAETGELRGKLHGHQNRPVGLALHPHQPVLASGAWDGLIGLWDLDCCKSLGFLHGHDSPIECVMFDPTGTLLVSGGWDRAVIIWDVGAHAPMHILQEHVGGLEMAVFSPDSTMVASCGCEPSICVWDVRQGRLRYHLHGHRGWVRCVAFSPDGTLLASGSDDGTVRLWDLTPEGNGTCREIITVENPYTGLKIGGASGITEVQRMALKALGAVES